jgi:predicted transcriptional regulator
VRREYLVRGRSLREIARELHISRNTVRKILRSGETEFVYEREEVVRCMTKGAKSVPVAES